MGLEASEKREEMEQSIAEEAMLTGMEGFLHKLNDATLKKHCTALSLDNAGAKKELVYFPSFTIYFVLNFYSLLLAYMFGFWFKHMVSSPYFSKFLRIIVVIYTSPLQNVSLQN